MGVYSTRFLLAGPAAGSSRYTVPADKRAVIKCFTICNGAASLAYASLNIAGVSAWIAAVPGNAAQAASGLGVVVNAGEAIDLVIGAAGMSGSVSGYLLDLKA